MCAGQCTTMGVCARLPLNWKQGLFGLWLSDKARLGGLQTQVIHLCLTPVLELDSGDQTQVLVLM